MIIIVIITLDFHFHHEAKLVWNMVAIVRLPLTVYWFRRRNKCNTLTIQ